MNADQSLRDAAKVLRERAQKATPGPWTVEDRFGSDVDRAYVMPLQPDIHSYVSAGGSPDLDEDAPYIATMHPGVGLALADWLLIEAHHIASHECQAHCPPDGCDEVRAALTVARAILGGDA